MKKKMFICMTNSMDLGGIESSLIGLLDAIDYEIWNVDLFLYGHRGPLMPFINPKVNLLPEVKELSYIRESVMNKLRHGAFYSAWRRIWDGLTKLDNETSWGRIVDRFVPVFPTQYDIALGFAIPFDVITHKVNAKIKVGWVHTDYAAYPETRKQQICKLYSEMDYIAAVSDACGESFAMVFPEYADKVTVIENILSESMVKGRADEFDAHNLMPDNRCRKLLTMGRYCYAKRMDEIPAICKELISAGHQVQWYLMGYGPDEELIREKIAQLHMEEWVTLIGKQENPYPYIKACDIYVQPSRFEGKSVAVREAQMLGKPVIITNYQTARDQLEHNVDGIIVPMETGACAKGISDVLNNTQLQERLCATCKTRDYSNKAEINKIYALMGE